MVPKSRRTVAAAPGNGGSDNAVFVVVGAVWGVVAWCGWWGQAILYVCSKVGCFLVSRPVVRSGRWC